jgi:hypothetical protein
MQVVVLSAGDFGPKVGHEDPKVIERDDDLPGVLITPRKVTRKS